MTNDPGDVSADAVDIDDVIRKRATMRRFLRRPLSVAVGGIDTDELGERLVAIAVNERKERVRVLILGRLTIMWQVKR